MGLSRHQGSFRDGGVFLLPLGRSRAHAALGPRYSLEGFEDAVVLGGNAPVEVMARNVGRHIAMAST